jgi:hypothetical protein
VVDPEGFGDLAAALTGFEPLDGFLLLMVVKLGFAAELLALLDGGDTPLIGALEDAVTLLFRLGGGAIELEQTVRTMTKNLSPAVR